MTLEKRKTYQNLINDKKIFEIEQYKLSKNITEKAAYLLGLSTEEFETWLKEEKIDNGVQDTAKGVERAVNIIITQNNLPIDPISFNKGRVSEVGKHKKLTHEQKSKIVKNIAQKKLGQQIPKTYETLKNHLGKIDLSYEEKNKINMMRYGIDKCIFFITKGGKEDIGTILVILNSLQEEYTSSSITAGLNLIFKESKVDIQLKGEQIRSYLSKQRKK